MRVSCGCTWGGAGGGSALEVKDFPLQGRVAGGAWGSRGCDFESEGAGVCGGRARGGAAEVPGEVRVFC